ncbi:SGNH/GDSL hydrolase family protein [Exiguobacterium sp. AB2]|uniref:SGNH/GDSL hydrolase family protein n=1 Tax=Exiguobacterium sp. AB2 TaxID=1484479 RepID=UPI0004A89593|nr:SGNH/GDSL hydrolase family protein [Exiguobacterium sp. AB2]KDN58437.1 hypothetical protein DI14_04675 [Exiguobacterium sp. AB2]
MMDYNIEFKDHIVEHPNRFRQVQVSPGIVDLIPTWIENPAQIIEEGTPVNADLFEKLRANVTRRSETFAATAGQTVFNLTKAYLVDQGRIDVYISGIKQRSGIDFTETSPTRFTLSEGLEVGTVVEAVYFSASQALSEDLIEQVQAAEAATLAANEAADEANDAATGALTANLNWKEPVNNLTALNALESPQTRDTRQTKDTGNVYRYDGTAWVLIQTMDPNAINALDTRLTSQLADIATVQLAVNILGTSYVANQKIDLEHIRQRQIVLYGNFMKKFRRKEAVKIVAQGDSLTYGHDTVSADKRPADTSTNVDNVVHTQTRASVTYPEALLSRLSVVNPSTTVENRGYSGDSVQDGFNRWKSKSNADLTIIDYGINDAQSYSNINGDLSAYFYWYEQLVIKTILQGSAVLLLSPTKIIASGNVGLDISTFRKALDAFAEKFDLPVLDGDEMLRNYDRSIYTDTVHLNGKGYNILGTRIAAAVLSPNVYAPLKMTIGSKLLTSLQRDNIYTITSANLEVAGGTPVPSETTTVETDGWVANLSQGGEVIYSFYADTDDLIVLPYFQISGDLTASFELDFGIEQAKTSIATAVGRTNAQKVMPPTVSKDLTGAWKTINKSSLAGADAISLQIATKGWHTLKIKNINTGSKNLYLHGIEFTHFDILKSLLVTNKTTLESSFYDGVFYPTYQASQPSVTETRVKLDDLKKLLNIDYSQPQLGMTWNDTPLKLTIYNTQHSILTYTFVMGLNTSSRFVSAPNRINITASPTERTLAAINVDWTSKELILTWGGDTSRPSKFQISIA